MYPYIDEYDGRMMDVYWTCDMRYVYLTLVAMPEYWPISRLPTKPGQLPTRMGHLPIFLPHAMQVAMVVSEVCTYTRNIHVHTYTYKRTRK